MSAISEWDPGSKLTPDEAQGVVGSLIIVVFFLMSFEIVEPDIAFFIALVIVLGCGILSCLKLFQDLQMRA